MSLKPIEFQKRVNTMSAGIYLALIHDIRILRNAANQPILNKDRMTFIVYFMNDKKELHEQHYLMDNDWRQSTFTKMLKDANVVPSSGDTPTKKDALGKRVWIAIKEIHHIQDDTVMVDGSNEPLIDKFIFRTFPYIQGGSRPAISGDPEQNGGTPLGQFMEYKNHSIVEKEQQKEEKKEIEVPEFDMPEEPKNEEPSFNENDIPSF